MRLKLLICGVTSVAAALLLAGCGMDQSTSIVSNMQSPAVAGRSFGGQQPIAGATIEVVAMGTTGYGSTGTVLASGTTDANGVFSFAPGAYTCPQSNTPVYLLAVGGDAGAGPNPSAVNAAALGTCSNAQQTYVVINEVTTAATAIAFSHYFSVGGTTGTNVVPAAATTNDWIGGPSVTSSGTTVYSRGLVLANNVTIPMLISNAVGAPNQGGNGFTIEWQKINTIANVLAACINSSGSTNSTETRTTCGKIFNYTRNGATTRPADTLQAAVQMALHPTAQVTNLYNQIGGNPPFLPYLTSAPNDWSVAVSFTAPTLGLAVDTGTVSTLDIDTNGRIWFPSNTSGATGAAYFDPTTGSFGGPYNTTGLTHPQQVAIDANGYAWFNDSATSTVAGYLVSSPTLTETSSLPSTISNSLSVRGDDTIVVGVTRSGLYEQADISPDRTSYSLLSGIRFGYPVASMAGDVNNNDAVTATDATTTAMRNYYVTSTPTLTSIVNANDDSGQVIYTGNDDISVRSYSGSGNADDGLCIYSMAKCYNFKGALTNAAEGIAIDGGNQLWVAESGDASVLQIPIPTGATGTAGGVYLNPATGTNIIVNELQHNGNDGEAATATKPYGIGVDFAGNVWVTNAGCNTADCTPGSFTLTEIVGAGYPTITPVSAQITSGNIVGTEPNY